MPSRSQRDSTGALPSRIARASTSWASPSISRKNSPGTSVATGRATRWAWRLTTLRYQKSSSSIASSGGQRRVDDGQGERDHDARAQVVDLQPGLELGDEQDDDAVEHDHPQAQGEHRERQRHADDERPYERVDEADERGGHERHAEVLDVEAAQQHAEQQQGQRGGHPHDEDAQDGQRALHGSSTRSPGCSTRASTAGAIRRHRGRERTRRRLRVARPWVGPRQGERAPVDRDGDAGGDPRRRLRRPLGVEVAGPERAAPAPHRQERDVDGAREVGHGHEEIGVAGEVDRARPAHHEAHRRDVDARADAGGLGAPRTWPPPAAARPAAPRPRAARSRRECRARPATPPPRAGRPCAGPRARAAAARAGRRGRRAGARRGRRRRWRRSPRAPATGPCAAAGRPIRPAPGRSARGPRRAR